MTTQMWFAGGTGVIFLAAMLFIFGRNLFNPEPLNPGAERFFRIMIALVGAAFAAIMTGFLTVELKTGAVIINAGAGLGVFVVLYYFDPPAQRRPSGSASLLRINFAPNWTLRQAIIQAAKLANGEAEFVGFTDSQLDEKLGAEVAVQGPDGLAVLKQLSKNTVIKTKFSVTYDRPTATYKVRSA